MRKKYLSALLFGALLVTSAGTFTSCKDYDDEINDLQEQVNTIKTDLESLKTTVEGLDGVKTLSYADGKLIIETGKGQKVEVDVPSATGIADIKLEGNVLYVNGEAAGKVEIPEGQAVNVEVKGGVLYINGEAQELNDEIGSKVAVVDNNNGTYTLTVDGASYVLPKATSTVAISIVDANVTKEDTYFFTNLTQDVKQEEKVASKGGILWSTADYYKEGTWKGLKPVTKGQLLVGQSKTLKVSVSPATFDLSTAKLSLVNTLGEPAPVVVTPTIEGRFGPSISESRAADANGVWDLSIEMDKTVTVDNIATAFAAKDANGNYDYTNVKYALAVDGKVVTGYNIYVDTDEDITTDGLDGLTGIKLQYKHNGNIVEDTEISTTGIKNLTHELPLGSTTLCLSAMESNNRADKIYDAYIEIVDKDMADAYGITVNGMTISASQSAGSLTNFPIKIHVLDIRGNELVSSEIMLKFEKSTQGGSEISAQEYKVMPTSAKGGAFVLVNLGETFTSLSADDAHKISNMQESAVKWYTTDDANTFGVTGDALEGGIKLLNVEDDEIKYYASEADALKDAMTGDEVDENGNKLSIVVEKGDATTIRTIKYAAISVEAFKDKAKVGANDLTIILEGTKDGRTNEIKRATTTLTVSIPTFDEILETNAEQNLWNEAKDTYSTRISKVDADKAVANFAKPYVSKKDANGVQYIDINNADTQLKYELTYKDFENKPQLVYADVNKSVEFAGLIVKDHKLIEEVNAEATLYPFGDKFENLKVTKTFKVDVMSIFEGASVVYYKDNTDLSKDNAQISLYEHQFLNEGSTTADNKKNGLFIKYNGEEVEFMINADQSDAFLNGVQVRKLEIMPNSGLTIPQTVTYIKPYVNLGEGATGTLTVDKNAGKLKITGLDEGQNGSVVFTFIDAMNVYTTATIYYKK